MSVRQVQSIFCIALPLPCNAGWFCDDIEDIDGRYGGKLMFDKILTDEFRFGLNSLNDDDESGIFDVDETGLF